MTNLNRTLDHRDTIAQLLHDLDPKTLTDLVRRSQHPATDAYPSTSGRTGNHNDISNPTLAKIIQMAGGQHTENPAPGETTGTADTWPQHTDHVADALQTMFSELAEMAGHAKRIERLRQYVQSIATTAAGRQTSLAGDCRACDRPVAGTPDDRLVSGYCGACRKAWQRLGYPDRHRFETTRPRWENGVVDKRNRRSPPPAVQPSTLTC